MPRVKRKGHAAPPPAREGRALSAARLPKRLTPRTLRVILESSGGGSRRRAAAPRAPAGAEAARFFPIPRGGFPAAA